MVIRFLGKKLSSFQLIILGFMALILAGALLLMLPISTNSGESASFENALFTSTSAVCVTGLIVKDTASYWSHFGQAVILMLIQVGGLGIISFAAFIATLSGRKISLLQRSMLQDSISAPQIGGNVKMIFFIFKVSMIVELLGMLAMLPTFLRQYGAEGIWLSAFHSVSAFCNAGFDIMGTGSGEYSSLTAFACNPAIVLPICLLIIIGGIGFFTWKDISVNKHHLRSYHMQSKVILAMTALLVVVPTLLFFFFEYAEGSAKDRILLSLFQAITPRTTGFNTASMTALTSAGRMLMIVLMIIGGAPGSTAGGMKITTFAVLTANALAVFRRKKNAQLFGRRLEEETIRDASTLFMMYLTVPLLVAAVISIVEGISIGTSLFETASAIGTVGLSMGITPSLGLLSHMILVALMFFGRVGGLTLIYAAISSRSVDVSQRPLGKITVG